MAVLRPTRAELRDASLRTLEALHKLADAAGGAEGPVELADRAISLARQLTAADSGWIVWLDRHEMQVLADHDHMRSAERDGVLAGELCRVAVDTGAAVLVNDYQGWEHAGDVERSLGLRAALAVPMRVRERVLGVIAVFSYGVRRFTPEDERLLWLFAGQIAPVLEAVRLAEERERQASVFRALHELAVSSSGELDTELLAQLMVDRCATLLGVECAVLAWWRGEMPGLGILASAGGQGGDASSAAARELAQTAFDQRRALIVNDLAGAASPDANGDRCSWPGVAVPLTIGERTLGAISCVSCAGREFKPVDAEVLTLVGAQMTPALESTNVARETAEQAKTLQALHELAVAIGGLRNARQMARIVIERAVELLGDSASLRWFDEGIGMLRSLADSEDVPLSDRAIPTNKGIVAQALAERKPVVFNDLERNPNVLGWVVDRGFRSALAVPLMVGDRAVGALIVRSRRQGAFDARHVETLTLLGSQVAPALAAARLAEETEALARTFMALHEVAVAASGVLEPEALARLASERAAELLACDGVTVGWSSGGGGLVALADSKLDAEETARLESRLVALGRAAFEKGEAVAQGDCSSCPDCPPDAVPLGVASVLAMPMKISDQPAGVFIARSATADFFGLQHERILSLLAAEVAPALDAARLHERLTEALATAGLQAQQQASVAELGRRALAGAAQDELMQLATEEVRTVLGVEQVEVAELKSPGELWIRAHSGPLQSPSSRLTVPPGTPVSHVLVSQEPVVIGDAEMESRFDTGPLRAAGVRSLICMPIRAYDESIGVLIAQSLHARRYWAQDEAYLRSIANLLADAERHERVQRELAESQTRLRQVIHNAPVVLFALDLDGTFVFAEGGGFRRLQVGPDVLVGRRLDEVVRDPEIKDVLQSALQGDVASANVHLSRSDSDLEVYFTPVRDGDGAIVRVIGVAVDVTERRRAEEARAESEQKSRFLAAMSHELRTPLNSVLGFAQLLAQQEFGALSERQQRYVEHILASGRHLLELINDVLDLSRVAAGQMQVRRDVVLVADVLDAVLTRVAPLADRKKLVLTANIRDGLAITADHVRLSQVLWNLLSNAIKFTAEGGQITVEARARGAWVELSVTDTGIGIAKQDQARIFEEFMRVDSDLTRSTEGTGLGLTLSRRLVQLMEGQISVRSAIGRGSAFTVRMPRASLKRTPTELTK